MTRKIEGDDDIKGDGEDCDYGFSECKGGLSCCSKVKTPDDTKIVVNGKDQPYVDPPCRVFCLDENCPGPQACW